MFWKLLRLFSAITEQYAKKECIKWLNEVGNSLNVSRTAYQNLNDLWNLSSNYRGPVPGIIKEKVDETLGVAK